MVRLQPRYLLSLMRTLAMILCGTGCLSGVASRSRFVPPPSSQPHAILKIRLNFHSSAGPRLDQSVFINGGLLRFAEIANVEDVIHTYTVRIPLDRLVLDVSSRFFHTESYRARQAYWEQVPYQSRESYGCGSFDWRKTCYRTVTRYRSVTRYHTVTRYRAVDDAHCQRALALVPEQGASYVLDYDFYEDQRCSLRCSQRVTEGPPGTFRSVPCPAPSQYAGAY
jgi:hypothetical protein